MSKYLVTLQSEDERWSTFAGASLYSQKITTKIKNFKGDLPTKAEIESLTVQRDEEGKSKYYNVLFMQKLAD